VGIFSGIGIVILALMYFKLFKDLSDEKIDFDTVRQSLFWFGPLSILLAIFGPALAYVGNSWLLDLTGAISPWTSNQIMDFATTISRFASYESNGVFGPLAAVLLFGLLFVGAWALLGLFALQPLALYLLGVGLALMIGFLIHPQYRARVAKTGSLWFGIALSKPLILLLMGALFSFISSRPAFQGEGTDDALINASSVFTAAAAMLVLAFSPALLSSSSRSCRPRPQAWELTARRLPARRWWPVRALP
jgi:Na+/phosphate symporter